MDHKLGFKKEKQITGRPSYPVRTLLGIYVYGYLHKIRTTRDLEKACYNNIELWWLIKGHKPCYKTIANFRKDNRKAFRNLFKLYRSFCKSLELYGRQTIAIDGSKFRAQNSMKNNFNARKIDRQLKYIETASQQYIDSLDGQDQQEAKENPGAHHRLQQLAERKLNYEQLREQLENSEERQISTTDPEARALPLKMNIVEVAYNVQSIVDDKHNMIVDYEVINEKDNDALYPMTKKAKEALDIKEGQIVTVLADKGYHKGEQLQKCHAENIDTLVAFKNKKEEDKKPHVRIDKFEYNADEDIYTCPQGQTLRKQARYPRRKDGKLVNYIDRYTVRHSICSQCPFHKECVSESQRKASQGKYIDRSEYQDAIDKNKSNVQARKEEYRRRQAIVEHPFGTIKRGWGYTYTLLKTKKKVETEFSIIFLCYNLRRTMSILGLEGLKNALKRAIWRILALISAIHPHNNKNFYHYSPALNQYQKIYYFYLTVISQTAVMLN